MTDNTAVRIYYYYDFTDTAHFCRRLEQRFRETGHERPLEFINWNCYKQQPGMDGDIYIYDAIALTALVDKGYLSQLPEVIDTSDMFSWTIDKSKVKKKTYGVPLMVCANTLICRKKDDLNIKTSLISTRERPSPSRRCSCTTIYRPSAIIRTIRCTEYSNILQN